MHRYHLSCQRHPPRYAYAGCREWPLPGGAGCSGIHHQLLVDRTSAHSNNGSSPSVVDKTRLPPSARASSPRYRSSPGPSLKVLVVPARPDIPSVSTRQNATAAGSNAQDIQGGPARSGYRGRDRDRRGGEGKWVQGGEPGGGEGSTQFAISARGSNHFRPRVEIPLPLAAKRW